MIRSLSDKEQFALESNWLFNARDEQYLPEGNWRNWLILAGRGWGKTRTGAETIKMWISQGYRYVNIIGATTDNARDIMIEGESGIMSLKYTDVYPVYVPSKRCIEWSNGAKTLIFTADNPEILRGKQSEKIWMDELASWRYPESFDQAMFGLRLGNNPQSIITTTPRPTKIIKELADDPYTHLTIGTTYDNRENLAPAFYEQIIKKYEGTRLGRQELNAEILEDNPNAIFKREWIDKNRIANIPQQLDRIIVAVDPAVTSNIHSNESGIVVVGNIGDHFYVLNDSTLHGTGDEWASRSVTLFYHYKADLMVGEKNQGGDLVEKMIRLQDRNIPYKGVHAARGKDKRAEPIGLLYEQNRVHHVGCFPELEDQMCSYDATLPPHQQESPDRMDALVWGLHELSLNQTPELLMA